MAEHVCSCQNCKHADLVNHVCRKYSCRLETICATEGCWEACDNKYCKLTRHECKYAPFNPNDDRCYSCVDREEGCNKYCPYFGKFCDCEKEEYEVCDLKDIYGDQLELLHDEDFDTWLTLVLDRQSNQLDGFMKNVDITVNSLDEKITCVGNQTKTIWADLDEHESRLLDLESQTSSAKYELLDDKIHHLKDLFEDLETQINDLSTQLDELKKFIGYHFSDPAIDKHTGCNFCGNCSHYVRPKTPATLPICDLSGEIVDPDASSCAMFEEPF